jgi:hypothetical protein
MDPLKCLAELDALVSKAPMDRTGHAHYMKMVAVIRQALTPKESDGDRS